jgi:hypothetical protein
MNETRCCGRLDRDARSGTDTVRELIKITCIADLKCCEVIVSADGLQPALSAHSRNRTVRHGRRAFSNIVAASENPMVRASSMGVL